MSTACAPEPPAPHGADAEVYVRALCEDVCAKFDECAPLPEWVEECNVADCFESSLDDPCLEEDAEWKRCQIERESCEDYFDAHLDTTPSGICYEFVVPSSDCAAAHINEG